MSQDLKLTLRLNADGSGLKGELRNASGEVVKFSDQLEGGAQKGTKALKDTERQADKLGNTTQQLTRRVAALAAGYVGLQSLSGLGRMADEYTNLNAQIAIVTQSADQQEMVFDRILAIASRTGQELRTVSQLATRTIRALESSGESAEEAVRKGLLLTQIVSDAVLASGASATEANAAMIQLAQGLASGQLRGEEFRSVMEQTPRVAQALANALGLTIGKLRELAEQGELTTQVVTDALISQGEQVAREASSIPPTIARAWQALENAVTSYVGTKDEGIGASREIAEALQALAENLDTVVDTGQVLAILIAGRLSGSLATWTAAQGAALAQSIRYQAALASMAGVSRTAAAGQLALAAATRAASGALALVGGPVGVATIAAIALANGLIDVRRELNELKQPSNEAEAALRSLRSIAAEGWQTDQIAETRRQLQELRVELLEVSRARAAAEGRMERSGGGMLGRFLRSLQDEGTEELRLNEELLQEQIRMAEHLAGIRHHEDIANGLALIQSAGEGTLDVLERLGIVSRNAAGGIGEMAPASKKFTDGLDEQLNKLEEQLIALRDGEQALLDHQEAQALATAAELDAKHETTAYTEAVRAHWEERRRLIEGINAEKEAEEQATTARREQAQLLSQMTTTFEQVLAVADPLAAKERELTGQLDLLQQMAGLSDEKLTDMGVSSQQLGKAIAFVEGRIKSLGAGGRKTLTQFEQIEQALLEEKAALEGGAQAWIEYEKARFVASRVSELDPEDANYEAQVERIKALAAEVFELREEIAETEAGIADFESASMGWEQLLDGSSAATAGFAQFEAQIQAVNEALREGVIDETQASMMSFAATTQYALKSVQQLASEGSSEYKAIRVALDAVALAQGVIAILNQGQGDPYSAPMRMVGMAAMVLPLLANLGQSVSALVGGGGDPTERRQETQGTGTVLGDSEAKSESIAKATEITADAVSKLVGINRSMDRNLQRLADGISGASGMLARGAAEADFSGINLDMSGLESAFKNLDPLGYAIDSFVGGLFGFGKTKVVDQGIELIGGTITDMVEGAVAVAFGDLKRKSLFGSSSKTVTEDLDEAFNKQLNLIFESLINTVLSAGEALGIPLDELQARIDQFEVEAQKISLEGLSAEEQQAELEAVFSAIFDDLASAVIPFIDQFQKVGEGAAEALIRVATSVQVVQESITRLGLAIDETDPERLAQISVGLIEAVGGIDEFITGMEAFVDKFAPESHKVAIATDDLTRALEQVGLAVPGTREEMWALMGTLDASTESGRQQIAMLLKLTDAADTYYSHLEAVETERLGLERELLRMQGDTAALRELELQKLDESNRALQQRIWALQDEAEIADIMADTGEEIARLSLSPLVNEFRKLSLAKRDLLDRARELGMGEQQLGAIRYKFTLEMQRLAASLEESIVSSWDQLRGGGSDFGGGAFGSSFTGPIEDAASQLRDALIRALEGVDEWLRRSAFEDPSQTGRQRFAALQAEFDRLVNVALTGSGQERVDAIANLPEIASELEALGVQMHGSATEPFQEFRQGLIDAMEQVAAIAVPEAAPDPVTGSQVGAIGSSVDSVSQSASQQTALAARILEEMGVLVEISGATAPAIAERLGVNLGTVIETLIGEVQAGSIETVEQLIAVANTLGMELTGVADAIGLHVGELADQESLLSEALQDAVLRMPPEIQNQLWGPLGRIWEATNEADANAAIADLIRETEGLPVEYKNALAPFFEEIDTEDLHLAEIGLLDTIRGILAESAWSLAEIRRALGGQSPPNQPPPKEPPGGYIEPPPELPPQYAAAGGWASGLVMTGDGSGPELILPAEVSNFFQRVGVPLNAGGSGSDPRVAQYLKRLVELEESAAQQREEAAERHIIAVESLSQSVMEAARLEASDRGMLS